MRRSNVVDNNNPPAAVVTTTIIAHQQGETITATTGDTKSNQQDDATHSNRNHATAMIQSSSYSSSSAIATATTTTKKPKKKKSVVFIFVRFVLLILVSFLTMRPLLQQQQQQILASQQPDGNDDPRQQQQQHPNPLTDSTSTTSLSKPVPAAVLSYSATSPLRSERIVYYKERYQYHPPYNVNETAIAVEQERFCGQGPDHTAFFALNHKRHSRYKEDETIYNIFFKQETYNNHNHNHNTSKTTRKRTYIELGAYNGRAESNTRFFDICLGWNGLLIEGNPTKKVWGRLLETRPRAHLMNFIPCCNEEDDNENHDNNTNNNSTFTFHAIANTNAGIEAEGIQTQYSGHPLVVQVPCGGLTPVLLDVFQTDNDDNNNNNNNNNNNSNKDTRIPHISFFSLDVEGSEHLVLETIDFTKVHIELLLVEVSNRFCTKDMDCPSRQKTRSILKRAGYVRFSDIITASDVFIHYQSTDLLESAKRAGWNITKRPEQINK